MKTYIIPLVIVLLAGGLVFFLATAPGKTGDLDAFATCLKNKGAIFYGAFWCSHCANQKAMFGRSAKLLPYVECSTPDGNSQLLTCTEKGIDTYPTWEFPGGERLTGEILLETLAQKTGCELPTVQ